MNLSSVCGVCMSIMYVSPKSVCRKDLGYKDFTDDTNQFWLVDGSKPTWQDQSPQNLLKCPGITAHCQLMSLGWFIPIILHSPTVQQRLTTLFFALLCRVRWRESPICWPLSFAGHKPMVWDKELIPWSEMRSASPLSEKWKVWDAERELVIKRTIGLRCWPYAHVVQ